MISIFSWFMVDLSNDLIINSLQCFLCNVLDFNFSFLGVHGRIQNECARFEMFLYRSRGIEKVAGHCTKDILCVVGGGQ